jgi:alanine dehydrogenase
MHEDQAPYFVSAAVAEQVLTMQDAIDAIRGGYSVPIPEAAAPTRVLARGETVWLRCLAAVPPSTRLMGTKVFGLGADRTVNYLISLFDRDSAKLVGLVDGCQITAIRTAATTAVAIDRMAMPGPVSVAILGSGLEARNHLRALACVRAIATARIYSPTPANRQSFASAAAAELGIAAEAADSAEAAVDGADIIIAAARSHGEKPILFADWVKDNAFIASIGSTLPEQREVDVSVVEASGIIICDAVEEVCEQSGDMIAARRAGVEIAHKLLSLNDLLIGGERGRRTEGAPILYKSVGSALQDVIVAELALDRAVAGAVAVRLELPLQTKHV